MTKEEQKRRMKFAREEVGRAWCTPKTGHLQMIPDLAEELAKLLVVHMYEPHLGCASTGEIIEELKARIEIDGKLDYRTIDLD